MDNILLHLPEHSVWEKDLLKFADDKSVNSDLGHIMSYCCELYDGIDPEDGWLFEPEQKRHWRARCRCSACGEELITAKQKGVDAVFFYEGEDGQLYEVSGDPAGYGEGGQIIRVSAGDKMTCPYCGASVILTHSSKIRGGRTKQIMVETLETKMQELLGLDLDMEGIKPVKIPAYEDVRISYADLRLLEGLIEIEFEEDEEE